MTREIKFLKTALALAEIWSKDPSSKVCAVAVGATPNLVAFGYNGFPPNIIDSLSRIEDRKTRLSLTIHAEENAILNAAFTVRALYVTHHPCQQCALRIVAARSIERVVYVRNTDFENRWQGNLLVARSLLTEANIMLVGLDT